VPGTAQRGSFWASVGPRFYRTDTATKGDDLKNYLAETGPWDIVHFNIGIHMFSGAKPGEEKPYAEKLRHVVQTIRDSGAVCLFANSTGTVADNTIPNSPNYLTNCKAFNAAAEEVMREMGVPVTDIYGMIQPRIKELISGDLIHTTAEADQMMAELIAKRLTETIATLPPKPKAVVEPTDADEAAANKQAEEAAVNEQYQSLLATLPPEEQAWERVLQDQLGSFYLPAHKRDRVAGRSNAWDFVKDDPTLPRVLLIGDSVSRGYTQAVRAALAGKANVHRAPANCGPTASGIKNIEVWLGDGKWDVIHFNFGIHDRNTPVADYLARLEQLVERMKKTGAKLVWASTTPIPDNPAAKQSAASVIERNAAAAGIMEKHGVAINDLFTFVTPHLADIQPPNDVHYTAKGYELLGKQVAEAICSSLPPLNDASASRR
jgi:lysophospholipase L1-like esterase